jgi:hypothetical protein
MSDKIKARHIVERWHLSIKKEDRTKENMGRIFDDVAAQLFAAGIEFDVAYEAMLESAKLMYPKVGVAEATFNKLKIPNLKFLDFLKNWQETLNKGAQTAFYGYFEIDGLDMNKLPQKPKTGAKNEDELNEEDFWASTKLTTRDKPWLFDKDQ